MARSSIGLDIGSFASKFVELHRRGRAVTVTNYGLIPSPAKMVVKGRVSDELALGKLITGWVDRYKLKSSPVTLGLNGPEITVRLRRFPNMATDELEQALEFELPELAGFPFESAQDVAYGYDYSHKGPTGVDVLFIACQRSLLTPYIRALKASGLELHVVDLQALTWPRVFHETGRICFVDIGAEQCTIYIELAGAYKAYRILPLGGAHITRGIAEAFECDEATALELQRSHDLDYLLSAGPGQKTTTRSLCQQLIGWILQTLDFLRAEERATAISEVLDEVVLLGGTSHIIGLDTMLSEELGIRAQIINPFLRHNLSLELVVPSDYGAYSTALGLAIRGLDG